MDWVIAKDVSFANATSAGFRGLLTWNRSALLVALPDTHRTMREYVLKSLKQRRSKVRKLLKSARSKISLSVDI